MSQTRKTPRSAIALLERAADACYAAADDARALALYSDAAYLYRQAGDLDGAVRCAEQSLHLRGKRVA